MGMARPGTSVCTCTGKNAGDGDGCGGLCVACTEAQPVPCVDHPNGKGTFSFSCSGAAPDGPDGLKACTCEDHMSKGFLRGCEDEGVSEGCPVTCGTCPAPVTVCPVTVRSTLHAGERLQVGESLTSPNGQYKAFIQRDGNFAVYHVAHAAPSSDNFQFGTVQMAKYATGMSDHWNARMQRDGNFVVYAAQIASQDTFRFGSVQIGKYAPYTSEAWRLVLQDDGDLCVYDGDSLKFSARAVQSAR